MHFRTAARRLAPFSRTAARQSVPRRVGVRYNTSSTAGASSSTSASASQQVSPFVAAAIGGGVVLAGVPHSALDSYQHVLRLLLLLRHAPRRSKHPNSFKRGQSVQPNIESAKDTTLDKTLPPNAIIQLLRTTAKSYVWFIPGASALVDASFDAVDRLEQTHREEVEAIVKRTYEEFLEVTKNGQADAQTAQKVLDILQRQSAELGEVAKKAAKHPEVTDNLQLGGAWISALSTIVTSKSEDAKKLLDETYSDVLTVLKEKGEKAKKLAEDAREEVEKGSLQSGLGKGEEEDEKKDEQKGGEKGK